MDLILTGRGVSGEEAERIGLVNRVVEPGEALAAAIRLAEELARLPQTCMRNDRLSAIEQWELGWQAAMVNELRLGQGDDCLRRDRGRCQALCQRGGTTRIGRAGLTQCHEGHSSSAACRTWDLRPAASGRCRGAFSAEAAEQSMEAAFEQFQLADDARVRLDHARRAPLRAAVVDAESDGDGRRGDPARAAGEDRAARRQPADLNPVRVAEEFAMLDVLTGGRLVAGMLRGTATEYVTYGTNPAESRERFEEALQLIVRAWTEPQPFGWQGRYYEYRTISIWPRPIQQPHPPIFMSGSSPESGELAARHRLHLGLAFTTVPLAREAARYYRERRRSPGGSQRPSTCSTVSPCTWPIPTSRRSTICACRVRRPGGRRPPIPPAIAPSVRPSRARATMAATRRPSAAVRRSATWRSASSRAIPGRRPRDGPGADPGHRGEARRGHPRPELPARLPRQDSAVDRAVRHQGAAADPRPVVRPPIARWSTGAR